MRAKPIGVMNMLDQGDADDKVIAVHSDDPEFSEVNSLEDLPPHRIKEIRRFFEDYKMIENKIVKVEKFFDRAEAFKVIDAARALYAASFVSKK